MFPKKLHQKLAERTQKKSLRKLGGTVSLVDFSSNDYLGFSASEAIFNETHAFLVANNLTTNGATGSRLLSGNHAMYAAVESMLCHVHKADAALVFNSGYDANLGFFSSIPQRGDVVLYDAYCHASIRDGIQLSNAKAYKFEHNNLASLETLLKRNGAVAETTVYVVTESVFSMDGDTPDLQAMASLCKKHNAHLVVDEAHALGVLGLNGTGEVQRLQLEDVVFARIVTFGKALGCHGAVVLGSADLKQYLVNFSRSLMYTTGLSPHALATIKTAYNHLTGDENTGARCQQKLLENSQFFTTEITRVGLQEQFRKSHTAIHCCVVSGNEKVKMLAAKLQAAGFDVKPILSPTVPTGEERLRFCVHSYNTQEEMTGVLTLLAALLLENNS